MVIYMKFDVEGTVYKTEGAVVTSAVSEFNSSSSFTATINNEGGYLKTTFDIYDDVTIYADKDVADPTTKIFKGKIERIKHSGQAQDAKITLAGRDLSADLQDALIRPEVYNDTEVSEIIKNLVAKYAPDISYANVDVTTTTLTRKTFNKLSLFDAIKQLAELSGYYFYVDTDKDLHFKLKESISSGITLNNTNVIKSDFGETDREVYNSVYVYGSRLLSAWQNNFTGDGAGSVFNLDYKPHNTNVTVSGALQKGGIAQISEVPSGVNYVVDFNERDIIFISGAEYGNSIPGSLVAVAIGYDRSVPVIQFKEDAASIAAYGRKVKVIQDDSIKIPDEASDVVDQVLDEYSDPRKQGTIYMHNVAPLTAGNTIIVDLPNSDVSSQTYQILEVTYNFTAKNMLADKVLSINVSKKILDLTDTLKDMLNRLNSLEAKEITDQDVVTRFDVDIGSIYLQVSGWEVSSNAINNSFYLDHAVNGMMGSPALGVNGSQLVMGSASIGGWSIQVSG